MPDTGYRGVSPIGSLAVVLVPDTVVASPGVRLRFLAEADLDRSDPARSRADIDVGAEVPIAADIPSANVGVDSRTQWLGDVKGKAAHIR